MEDEFENWFKKHYVKESDLDKVKRGEEYVYFFTTTKLLFQQFCEIKRLEGIVGDLEAKAI